MTHFEYISVAVALILSLVASRLLAGVSAATQRHRAYAVHVCWIAQSLFSVVVFWWGFWGTQIVQWTGVRFGWALLLPALLFVKAEILIGANPESTQSFRDHFFLNRVRFFSVGLATSLTAAFSPLVNGASFETFVRLLAVSSVGIAINVAGLLFRAPRLHAVLSVIAFLYVSAALLLLPAPPPRG